MRKNIVHYVTARYMKQNKKRTFTTFLGIVLMVTLMTCVFVGKDTGMAFMEYAVSLKDGKWHVSFYDTDEKGLEEAKKLSYVKETALSANYGNTEFPFSAGKSRPYLTVKAYTENCFDWMNIELKEGRFPKNGSELLLSESVLKDGAEIKIGDTVSAEFFNRSITGIGKKGEKTVFPFWNIKVEAGKTVEVPQDFPFYGEENPSIRENREYTGKKQTYKIVGIMETPGFENADSGGYTAITAPSAKEIEKLQKFNLSVRFHTESLPDMFGIEIREKIPCSSLEFNDYLLAMSQNSQDTTMNLIIGFLMGFFILLIMLASVVLIYNVFNISYRERSRYLGMLSSVGATARQKRSSIYYEAFVLLIPALAAGILLGMAVIKAGILSIRPLLARFMGLGDYMANAPVSLKIAPEEIFLTVAVSIVTVLISAYLPARKIGKTGAISSIRGNEKDKKERKYRTKMPFGKKFAGEKLLSRSLLKRQKKKNRSLTAAAVTFLVIVTVTLFGASAVSDIVKARLSDVDFNTTFDKWNYMLLTSGYDGDYDAYNALKKEILANPTVTDAVEWYNGMFVGEVGYEALSEEYRDAYYEIMNLYYNKNLSETEFEEMYRNTWPLSIVAVDDETLRVLAERAGADYKLLKERPSALIVKEGELSTKKVSVEGRSVDGYRNFHISQMSDLKKGDMLDAAFWSPETKKKETLSMEVAGFADKAVTEGFFEINSQFLWIITSHDTAETIRKLSDGQGLLERQFYFQCDETDRGFLEKLEKIESEGETWLHVAEVNKQTDFYMALEKIVKILAISFMAASSLICFLNLFNSIRGRMEERRGEFAVLKSIGMTNAQIQRMLLLENLGILAKSILYGGMISAAVIFFLKKKITDLFGVVAIPVPWAGIIVSAVLMAGVVLLVCTHSFAKEKDRNLLESIRSSSV